jgi:hypothetical protein
MSAQAPQINSAMLVCKNNQHHWTADHICSACSSRRCRATCAMSGRQCLNKASSFPNYAGKPLPAELQNFCNNHLHAHFYRGPGIRNAA